MPTINQDVKFDCKYLSVVNQGKTIADVVRTSFKPACHVKRISKDMYMKGRYDTNKQFISTGEVFDIRRKEKPMRNRRSLRKIFKDLRQLIAHNCEGGARELFVTLTYAEQTNNNQQIHDDFNAYWKRLKRAYPTYGLEYISVVEPHETGMFHIHVLLKATTADHLYIPNEVMARIWGHGFTTTERLEDIDHMGAYVIAYMTDAEIPPEFEGEYAKYGDIVEKNGKKYIKGKRLDYYPDGMQISRHSRGMVRPDKLTGAEAESEVALLEIAGIKKYSKTKEIEQTNEDGSTRTAYVQVEQIRKELPFDGTR